MSDREKLKARFEELSRCTEDGQYATIGAEDVGAVLDLIREQESRWIPVTERLPEEGEPVFAYDGDIHIAELEKGISAEERERMKNGEISDPVETGWNLSKGYFSVRRSEAIKQCDEYGNNERPYCWRCHGGVLFGQNVKYWMPLHEPPKEEEDGDVRTLEVG